MLNMKYCRTENVIAALREWEDDPGTDEHLHHELYELCSRIAADARARGDFTVDEMVSRFLGWKLPKDFAPDAGISFKPMPDEYMPHCWPTGTNLFNAEQARGMILYILGNDA